MDLLNDLEKSMKSKYYYKLELSITVFGSDKDYFEHIEEFSSENLQKARSEAFREYYKHLTGLGIKQLFRDKKIINPSQKIELGKTAAFSVNLYFIDDNGFEIEQYSFTEKDEIQETIEAETMIFNKFSLEYTLPPMAINL